MTPEFLRAVRYQFVKSAISMVLLLTLSIMLLEAFYVEPHSTLRRRTSSGSSKQPGTRDTATETRAPDSRDDSGVSSNGQDSRTFGLTITDTTESDRSA